MNSLIITFQHLQTSAEFDQEPHWTHVMTPPTHSTFSCSGIHASMPGVILFGGSSGDQERRWTPSDASTIQINPFKQMKPLKLRKKSRRGSP